MKLKYPLLYILIISLFAACSPDDDDNPTPTDDRDKFVASWTCNENSSITGANPPFTVSISKGTATDEVQIANFYGLGSQYKAIAEITVNDIEIYTQVLAGNTIKGLGSLVGNTITMQYTVNDGASIDTVSATFVKQ